MYTWDCLAPRFIVFKYMIKWYIDKFGMFCYIAIFVGVILIALLRAIILDIKMGEYDRVIMIIIFTFILIGGLIGVGLDMYNGSISIP
ncbi:hypothetical protein [Clostridium sp. KNHs214]|uniref:hypothetical protein n=1 Tax=Clostridium sp. KNHs214 TaxID=1540257 RepID=UPI0005527802|nr:hypothetical protein [Clostridium sp. KNHs214]